jgi:hypothetical protein
VLTNQGTAKPIAVLRGQMRVVPECARLIGNLEVVKETVSGGDRALVDKRRTIRPVCGLLEETMPVLQKALVFTQRAEVMAEHVQWMST